MSFDMCPNCGYKEAKQAKMFGNEMHEYVNAKTGKLEGVFNSVADKLTIKGIDYVRKDKYVAAPVKPEAKETK